MKKKKPISSVGIIALLILVLGGGYLAFDTIRHTFFPPLPSYVREDFIPLMESDAIAACEDDSALRYNHNSFVSTVSEYEYGSSWVEVRGTIDGRAFECTVFFEADEEFSMIPAIDEVYLTRR